MNTTTLAGRHDLSLSDWGPYSKRYIGVSHIPDVASGVRVDFSLMPGFYRRETPVPNVRWESAWHPWKAAPDLSFYRNRHELLWKDELYCDVDFCRLDDGAVLTACTFVNNTAAPQNTALHQFAWINFPPVTEWIDEPLRPARVELPAKAVWVGAEAYIHVEIGADFPRRTLLYDGYYPNDFRWHGFTGGFGIGGDTVRKGTRFDYSLRLPCKLSAPVLLLRGRLKAGAEARVQVAGLTPKPRTVLLKSSEDVFVHRLALTPLDRGHHAFNMTILDATELAFDGFAFAEARDADRVRWVVEPLPFAPTRLAAPRSDSIMLKFQGADPVYGAAWDGSFASCLREFVCEDLDCLLRLKANEHVRTTLIGSGKGHYTNIFVRPVFLKPKSSRVLYGLFCRGTENEVRKRLAAFKPNSVKTRKSHAAAVQRGFTMNGSAPGEKFRFGQELMAAATLANVVYPIRTRGQWIKHNSPGRYWDSLYTWDAGFSALGLAELDAQRAIECINAYVTEPGDETAAFIHHGSPVPSQFYAFNEVWNRAPSRDLAAHFFPRLRQYHRFLAGREGSSTTRALKSNLLKTWDYFYNSGGWDDYPPQVQVHRLKLTANTTPVVNTAHAIRTAKFLKAMADVLGEDAEEFDADIAVFSDALQSLAWDEKAGYFSYVTHDANGRARGFLRHQSGQNFNMGMDGLTPLVAGICTPEQERRMVGNLMNPRRLWCHCGISTVDQSAAYYRHDGYWNGAVWFPHQWFIWKTLLDLGEANAAWKIASTALEVWRKETGRSYHCFEHFIVETGRGAGWHACTSLPAPILAWFGAYYRHGRLTTGFDITVRELDFAKGTTGMTAVLSLSGQMRHTPVVLVGLKERRRYAARWNGAAIPVKIRLPGMLEIQLPCGAGSGPLEVEQT